jgi:hypothetical protein
MGLENARENERMNQRENWATVPCVRIDGGTHPPP